MDVRQLINEMAKEFEAVNKTFTARDKEANFAHYETLRGILTTLQVAGAKVHISETWESGLVCVEVSLDNVRF